MMMYHGGNNGFNHGPTPAERLTGMELLNGWKVERPVNPPANSYGGLNSKSYIVNSETQGQAFLKAMDYTAPFANEDVMNDLYAKIQGYYFERDLLRRCIGMSRVVSLLDSGEIHINPNDRYEVVHYLIFELADGDVRPYVGYRDATNIPKVLQMMHQATVGLKQLHTAHIAHQDIKPANVLLFGTKGVRLGDLVTVRKQRSGLVEIQDIDVGAII